MKICFWIKKTKNTTAIKFRYLTFTPHEEAKYLHPGNRALLIGSSGKLTVHQPTTLQPAPTNNGTEEAEL
jgi:hypothetical protein